jgi:hypothetical protein
MDGLSKLNSVSGRTGGPDGFDRAATSRSTLFQASPDLGRLEEPSLAAA